MAENTSTENAVEGSSTVSTGNGDGNQVQNGTDQSAQVQLFLLSLDVSHLYDS